MNRMTAPIRSRRRAYMQNVRRKARLKAERMHAESFRWNWGRHRSVCSTTQLMRGGGHWLNGGCNSTHCGICKNREQPYRDKRDIAVARADLNEYHGAGHNTRPHSTVADQNGYTQQMLSDDDIAWAIDRGYWDDARAALIETDWRSDTGAATAHP